MERFGERRVRVISRLVCGQRPQRHEAHLRLSPGAGRRQQIGRSGALPAVGSDRECPESPLMRGAHLESNDEIADTAEDGEEANPKDEQGGSGGDVLL